MRLDSILFLRLDKSFLMPSIKILEVSSAKDGIDKDGSSFLELNLFYSLCKWDDLRVIFNFFFSF